MIKVDAQGRRYSDLHCNRCDNPPPHYPVWGGSMFQCDLCKSPVGDTDEPPGTPATWLPRP